MTFEEFNASLQHTAPPAQMSAVLQSLWHQGKGDWEASHNIAQDIHTNDGSWIHAHLHRAEGDLGNASYWYHRANKPVSKKSLSDEWEEIVRALL
jgi:hypothetical protein